MTARLGQGDLEREDATEPSGESIIRVIEQGYQKGAAARLPDDDHKHLLQDVPLAWGLGTCRLTWMSWAFNRGVTGTSESQSCPARRAVGPAACAEVLSRHKVPG